MTHRPKFKASIFARVFIALLYGGAAIGIASCKAPASAPTHAPKIENAPSAHPPQSTEKLAPLKKALSCLPQNAAIIAAHRGTDERWKDIAENSIGGLKALIDHGSLMAEIDVAGLKDGTLITFHDGIWDEISTGKGPVASTRKDDLENILLKSRAGKLTADRPPLFSDMLNLAKGKIYIEIDFKSSADYRSVINAIHDADMADQVLLISYSARQSAQLERLAPEMLRSNPPDATQKGHAVWLGYDVANGSKAKSLKAKGNYTIGRIGDPRRQPPFTALRKASDILVTDQAERYDGIEGLNRKARAEYEACLLE